MNGIISITIFIYTLSVYGIAWIITQSYIFQSVRDFTEKLTYSDLRINRYIFEKVNYLINCIVCTSVWVGIIMAILTKTSPFFRHSFPSVTTPYDIVIWGGYCAATSWLFANLLDDAD